MSTKSTKKKNYKQRNDDAAVIAQACNCTPAYVRMVLNGARENNSEKAQQILGAYERYIEQKNELLKSVKQLVNF